MSMGFLRRYLDRRIAINDRLREIDCERNSLKDLLLPDKIQSTDTPYYQNRNVVESVRRLKELAERRKDLYEGRISSFYRALF